MNIEDILKEYANTPQAVLTEQDGNEPPQVYIVYPDRFTGREGAYCAYGEIADMVDIARVQEDFIFTNQKYYSNIKWNLIPVWELVENASEDDFKDCPSSFIYSRIYPKDINFEKYIIKYEY